MTTIEIIDYLKAMSRAEIGEGYIQNNSGMSLWFAVNRIPLEVKPYERVTLGG